MKNKTILFLILVFSVTTNLLGQNYERYKKLIDTTINSKYLGFSKNITITVPIEWQKDVNHDFPLIIVFDRQNPRSHNYILNTIDYLTSNEQMPSSILVSVESDDKHRVYETLHKVQSKKGLAYENEQFLFDELIPLFENQYKASPFRVLIGHSRYGYFTTSLLSHRINDLNAVVAISPFFNEDNVNLIDSVSVINRKIISNQKFFRFAIGGDYPNSFHKMDSLIKLQAIPKFNAKGLFFPEAAHNVTPGLAIASSLYDIFEYWSKNQNLYLDNQVFDATVLDSLSGNITSYYGQQLNFSLGALNGKGWYFFGEDQYESAIKSWEILLNSYPNFSEGYLYILQAQLKMKKDYSETINRFNASLSSSNMYSEKEKDELRIELKTLTN